MAKELTTSNFEGIINNTDQPVLVDFWAEWCGPCRMLTPTMTKLTKQYEGKAVIAKVNVDEQGDLARKFGVTSIPSVFVFKNGKVVDKSVGVNSINYYTQALDKACN